MNSSLKCWCGNSYLLHYSPGYVECPACHTLVSSLKQQRNDSSPIISYGKDYWFSHQTEDLYLPDILQRSRQDLPERCLYWLRTLLQYRLPPGRVLDLGSGHGGFVAFLRWAGFEATGLELSPWVVEFAQETFHVPMLLGEIETQKIPQDSLDVIVLMDVLEHLPAPFTTVCHCLELLRPNGLLIIQTPQYPEGKTYDDLEAQGSRFLEMLKADEHLFLFSQKAILEFFHRLGATYLQFEPAIFSSYDMFLLASRSPIQRFTQEEIEKFLATSPERRMEQALLDLDLQKRHLFENFTESEADRAARLEVINHLTQQLKETEAALKESEADRAAHLEQAKASLNFSHSILEALRSGRVFRTLRKIGIWKGMEELILQALPPHAEETKDTTGEGTHFLSPIQLSRIAVDLTPLLPGGDNGGAKLLAIELVRHLSQLAPECNFVLLTSDQTHEEISFLDAPNVTRLCVRHVSNLDDSPLTIRQSNRLRLRLKEWLSANIPSSIYAKLKAAYFRVQAHRLPKAGILKELGVDLLFCPFTMPFYYDPAVPVVSVIYDLQYRYHPQFFEMEDRLARERNFKEACRLADRLVCISEYVRSTVLENSDLLPENVVSIPIRLFDRLQKPDPEIIKVSLQKYGLEANDFLLYPANFWPHKNHLMLFTAFGMFRSRHPESKLSLLCTGAPSGRMETLQKATRGMGLNPWIHFLGFLSENEFAALLSSCRALIFPSLYEGFGMPVLEAMAFGKPVLCSNVTSLPEVGGDAVIYFDPRKPTEILKAIESIEEDSGLVIELIERGKTHLSSFGNAAQMAAEYLVVFRDAEKQGLGLKKGLHGVYADGWTGRQTSITYDSSTDTRFLEITLRVPDFHPHKRVSVRISNDEKKSITYPINRGQSMAIRHPLSPRGGILKLTCDPIFQPSRHGINNDGRWLGCLCENCTIHAKAYREDLLPKVG